MNTKTEATDAELAGSFLGFEPTLAIPQHELDRLFHGELLSEEDIIALDHRLCDCELTYVHRKKHAALGTAIQIRLCCLAKKVEELAGLPKGTFFKAIEFEPSWQWDCNAPQTTKHRDRTTGKIILKHHALGPPPRWLRERMEKKGIAIKNDQCKSASTN